MSQLKYWNGSAWVTAVVGVAGSTGPQGPSGTLAIGTVTATGATGTPSITNVGTSTAAQLNFVLQQGNTGAAAYPTYTFSTTTTAGSNGAGTFGYNSATLSSVTAIYFDVADAGAINRTAWYTAWGTPSSTIKGYLAIKNTNSGSSDATIFAVTGVTNNTSYYTISVTYISGAASVPAASSTHTVDFARTGDTGGATGPTGPTGAAAGGVASLTSTPAITGTAETVAISASIAGGTFVAGSVYRITVHGARTGGVNSTVIGRIHVGATTLLAGSIVATNTVATTATNSSFVFDGIFTVKTTGASGTAIGGLLSVYGGTSLASTTTTAITVDTTVTNLIEFSLQGGTTGNTYTIYNAYIEQVK